MATTQMVKTSITHAQTTTVVSRQQSLETVQILLHSALSTIFYLREFFPESTFEQHTYPLNKRHQSYDEYLKSQRVVEPGTTVEVIHRGKSRRADALLDILEKGAFPLLGAGVLKQLILKVVPDQKHSETVLETYSFTIRYRESTNGLLDAALDLDRSSFCGERLTNPNMALHTFIRELGALCEKLPRLPDRRFFTLQMTHDDAQGDLLPVFGCKPTKAHREMFFPRVAGWERQTKLLHDVNSGFHRSSLRIIYLEDTTTTWMIAANLERPALPAIVDGGREQLADPDPSSCADAATDIGSPVIIDDEEERQAVAKSSANSSIIPCTPQARDSPVHSRTWRIVSANDSKQNQIAASHVISNTQGSALSNTLRMKSQLRKMNQPEQLPHGGTQPQMVLRPRHSRNGTRQVPPLFEQRSNNVLPQAGRVHETPRTKVLAPATPKLPSQQESSVTPASCLDLPTALSPYKTPHQATSPQGKRRSRGTGEDQAGSLKRRRTTVEAEFVMNINGLSSSPFRTQINPS